MVRRTVKVKGVTIKVHPAFFNKLENERKRIEKRSGVSLSQVKLTEALSQFKINFPTVGRDLHNATKKTKQKG
jgi:hypothetical protein